MIEARALFFDEPPVELGEVFLRLSPTRVGAGVLPGGVFDTWGGGEVTGGGAKVGALTGVNGRSAFTVGDCYNTRIIIKQN